MQNWCNQIFRKSYVTDLILWSEKLLRKCSSVGYKLQFCISAVNRELKAPSGKLANLTLQLNLMHKIDLVVEVEVIVTGTAKSSLCFWKQTNLWSMVEKRRKSGYKLQFCIARCNRELKAPFCKLANLTLQRYLRCIDQTSHFSIDERLHADRTFWKVSYCRQWTLELDRTHQNFSSQSKFVKAEEWLPDLVRITKSRIVFCKILAS